MPDRWLRLRPTAAAPYGYSCQLFPISSRRLLSLIRIQTNARAHVRSAHAKSSGTNPRKETHRPATGGESYAEGANPRIRQKSYSRKVFGLTTDYDLWSGLQVN